MYKFIMILLLLIGINSNAQETSISIKPEFTCDKAELTENNNLLTLIGNVAIDSEHFKLVKADKVIYNKKTNEMVITGFEDFEVDGKIQIKEGGEMNTLIYNLEERIAYIE